MRLAAANEAVLHAEQLAQEASRTLAAADHAYRQALAQGVDNDSLDRHRTWIDTQRSRLAVRTRDCADRRLAAHEASQNAMQARRRMRMLEKLRERALKRHLADIRLREAREADTLAVLKHARRAIEEGH